MKNNVMFNFDYLFGDYFCECSAAAQLYYVKLMFFADNGFVANPISVLDSMGYDISVYNELVASGQILKLDDRKEIFITAYFIHNKFNPKSIKSSHFYIYWRGKLRVKRNGVATFNNNENEVDLLEDVVEFKRKGYRNRYYNSQKNGTTQAENQNDDNNINEEENYAEINERAEIENISMKNELQGGKPQAQEISDEEIFDLLNGIGEKKNGV